MSHVQIDYHQITACYLETAQGRVECPEDVGRFKFIVTVFDGDDPEVIWDGDSYAEAIRIAEEARADWGFSGPVVDEVVR